MDKTIIGLFEDPEEARDVLYALSKLGIERERIGLITPDRDEKNVLEREFVRGPDFEQPEPELEERARARTFPPEPIGVTGGVVDHIGSLSYFNFVGTGPIIAAGPFAVALADHDTAESTSPLVNALAKLGVMTEDAIWYTEHVLHGGSLVSVEIDEDEIGTTTEILQRHGAMELAHEEVGENTGDRLKQTDSTGRRPAVIVHNHNRTPPS